MFDPTAYENIKVILEGAVYDYDLEGQITVLDRNDTFNLSKLTRTYTIQFSLNAMQTPCDLMITLSTLDLYKEIALNQEEVGCKIQVGVHIYEDEVPLQKLKAQMISVWGARDIDIKTEYSLNGDKTTNIVEIDFDRLIKEDDVDDVVALVDHCIHTLQILSQG
ncbi:hypothetical protein GCM10008967_43200 [Bacillus carboniphilus]|uniref:Uncharacterized protein n=1 Tax=Bacillus carboniphilus TaxID=86663 RepID=A0ABN0WWC4_9BACI